MSSDVSISPGMPRQSPEWHGTESPSDLQKAPTPPALPLHFRLAASRTGRADTSVVLGSLLEQPGEDFVSKLAAGETQSLHGGEEG